MTDKEVLIAIGSFITGVAAAFIGSKKVQEKTLVAGVTINKIRKDKKAIRQIMKTEVEEMKKTGELPDFLQGKTIDYDMTQYNENPSPEEQRLIFEGMLAEAMEMGIVKDNPLFDWKKNR